LPLSRLKSKSIAITDNIVAIDIPVRIVKEPKVKKAVTRFQTGVDAERSSSSDSI